MLHTVFAKSGKKMHIAAFPKLTTSNERYLCGRESGGGESVFVKRTDNLSKNVCFTCHRLGVMKDTLLRRSRP